MGSDDGKSLIEPMLYHILGVVIGAAIGLGIASAINWIRSEPQEDLLFVISWIVPPVLGIVVGRYVGGHIANR